MRRRIWTRAVAGIRSAFWTLRLHWDAWRSGGTLLVDRTLRLRTRVLFQGQGTLVVGPHVVLGDTDAGRPGIPIVLAPRHPSSRILIGPQTRLTNGVEITSARQVELGRDCLIGPDVRIVDADFHGIHRGDRNGPGRSAAVMVEDNVWIGMGAMVLKGVRIGAGAVIGAGTVVVKDIPAEAVAAGNPARVVSSSAETGASASASR